MTTTRRIGAVAALSATTASIALLTGLAGARADELADLKANQQILQQELYKLQQAQALPGGAPVPSGGVPSLAGSFPRSFLIPGTDTSIAIGGYIKFDAADYINGGGGAIANSSGVTPSVMGAPTASGIPLKLPNPPGIPAPAFNASSRGHNVFHMSAAESRLRVETRTPTSWGSANTVLEFDFYGCTSGGPDCSNLAGGTNPVQPRLRLAYGTLGGFHAGQDFVPVNDLQASPDLFDFGGDVGQFGFPRTAWVGYTWQLPYDMTFLVAGVNPSTSAWGPFGGLTMDAQGTGLAGTNEPATGLGVNPFKTSYPDANFVWRINRPWGALQLSGIVQDLKIQDGAYLSKEYIGYGGGFGLHVVPGWFGWNRDNFGLNGFGGSGLGHYEAPPGSTEPTTSNALATNFGGAAVGFYGTGAPGTTTAANAARVIATTVSSFGVEGNYQHFWAPSWRSTISAGYQHQDIPTTLVGPASAATQQFNKNLLTAHVNIIWSPVAFIDTGFEFIYDHRVTIYHQSASAEVVDYAFKVKF